MSGLATTLTIAFADQSRVDEMIPVLTSTVPVDVRDDARAITSDTRSWREVYAPSASRCGCRYGCKLYARRWGSGIRYAVRHSSTYGHPRPKAATA